ncbi:MAG: UPF0175 family protein [Promethearchaeota archaeon]
MMTNVISTRLDEKEIEELNKISKKEHIDRSALMRKFLIAQISRYKVREAGELYRKGLVSLAEAATLANVSIYSMMEYVEREKIQPQVLTKKEMEKELKNTWKLLESINK